MLVFFIEEMYKYAMSVYLCKIEALRIRYMGRGFYPDENTGILQMVYNEVCIRSFVRFKGYNKTV